MLRICSCCSRASVLRPQALGGEYSATLAAVVNTTDIPYRYLQLDSWRYFKVPIHSTTHSPPTPQPETLDLNLTSMQAAGSTGGEGVPLGGGLKNWTTNATWFAGETVPRSLHAL